MTGRVLPRTGHSQKEVFRIEPGGSTDTVVSTENRATRFHVKHPNQDSQVEETSTVFDGSTPLAHEIAELTRRRQAIATQTLPLPSRTRIFTISNQKGGVGKTTTVVNLSAALAKSGARVLVIDLDPQGNASTALSVEHREGTPSVYDVIVNDRNMDEVIQKSPEFDGLFCVPATIDLAGAEIELVSMVAREQRLSRSLNEFLDDYDFDYVLIDCPPSLGLLTINAFVAASEVLIPIQCEYYALEGLSQLLKNIQLIEKHLNPKLRVSTILLTMYDSRTNLAHQVAEDVRTHFPKEVLDTIIPRSVRISEAPSYGQSVISYDTNSSGSLSYLEAAAEIARQRSTRANGCETHRTRSWNRRAHPDGGLGSATGRRLLPQPGQHGLDGHGDDRTRGGTRCAAGEPLPRRHRAERRAAAHRIRPRRAGRARQQHP